MAETPLTDSIEALTTYANQVTGASDTNLSDAVYTLAQGYGGSGGRFDVIGDVTVSDSDVQKVRVNLPANWNNIYDYIFILLYIQATPNNSWIYYTFNSESLSGPYNVFSSSGINFFKAIIHKHNNSWYLSLGTGTISYGTAINPTGNDFVCFPIYDRDIFYTIGSNFKVFGAKIS